VSSLPAIGIDVGGTKIAVGVVLPDGSVVDPDARPTPQGSQQEFLDTLEAAIRRRLEAGPVAAVGIGVPSRIDQVAHRVVGSVHAPLAGIDLAGYLEQRIGEPVFVDNDGNAAGLAEWTLGAGRGTRDFVMLTLGTGIGAGLILDGRPYRGGRGAGVELGHMVVQWDGPPCGAGCPGRGHLEALTSGSAADRVARELGLSDGRMLVDAAWDGDGPAVEALAGIGRILGEGMVTIVNVFVPEVIAVGGGFGSRAGELLLGPAREVVATEALDPGRDIARIVPAELGAEAGLVGAGLVALERLGERA
jgi:glucokinase